MLMVAAQRLQSHTLPSPDEQVVGVPSCDVHMAIWKFPSMVQPSDTLHCNDDAVVWGKVVLQVLAALGSCSIFCQAFPVKVRMGRQLNASGVWTLFSDVKMDL